MLGHKILSLNGLMNYLKILQIIAAFWFNILIIPSANKKMITGKDAIRGAGMVISYLVMGDLMTEDEIADVRQIINNARATDDAELPPMI